jgi:thiamine-phosphate pyrophosphorylase
MDPVFNPGLYAITAQRYPDSARLVHEVREALEGGAAMIQFRDKSGDQDWRETVGEQLLSVCTDFEAPLIINDDIGLAVKIGAAGVHLGEEDEDTGSARSKLGQEGIIGVSCYDSMRRAHEAVRSGADYLAFGSVFPSSTKPCAVACPLEILRKARTLGVPVVAIGGITPENGRAVVDAGADGLAVISGVFNAPSVRQAAKAFFKIWAA